uniref:Uncharacterized protein n=1 Tax=Neogobius melanostomus TaxID=47308 RepID=A0A8C6WFH5_9GOBI
ILLKQGKKIVESCCPEKERLPHDWKNKTSLQKLIILRALRPDRITYALKAKYVEPALIEFEKLYEDSRLKLGFSIDQGTLHNVSLGQGQEEVAERAVKSASQLGHWVILQNVHLVASWLLSLEALLETSSKNSHPDFRVFMTGEPAPCPEQHVVPRGILENAIKITNEPPTGMNASLHDMLDLCSREQEFNLMLFSLCFFHASLIERCKFGPQGWNHKYPFSTGDLTISSSVLYNYLEVPWEDLCYLFGEIMYGGHITDDWDRRVCRTYLQELMNPKMVSLYELLLCPGFLSPPFMDYSGYHSYIDEHLPSENPTLYGLHLNAELECLTVTSDNLLRTLFELQPRDCTRGEGAAQSTEDKVLLLKESAVNVEAGERTPYVLICFQECERMNHLITEIRSFTFCIIFHMFIFLHSKGELTISSRMETLQSALFSDVVPDSWARLSYPSTKTLAHWFNDVLLSCQELDGWTHDFVLPAVVWLSGLFNPQSFLTGSVLQSIARRNQWPLDRICLTVDVTKKTKDDFGHPPREGAYIHGLFMEGLNEFMVQFCLQQLAVLSEEQDLKGTYECPVYRTKLRGSTYVWTFHLKTRQPPAKWIIAGVALLPCNSG